MRSRLLYRGPVTGIVDARTTRRDRDPPAAARRHGRRDLRAANTRPPLPVRHARARHAPALDRRQGLRRRAAPRRARVPRLSLGPLLERVHATDRARGASVPALRRSADDGDGRPAHGSGASRAGARLAAAALLAGGDLDHERLRAPRRPVPRRGRHRRRPGNAGRLARERRGRLRRLARPAAGATRSWSPTAAGCARSWRISRASTSTSATACGPAHGSGSPEPPATRPARTSTSRCALRGAYVDPMTALR